MTTTPSRLGAQLRRLLLTALVVAAVTALAPSPAMADADSVAITSPASGTSLTEYAGSSTLPADVPLAVTFTATGSPTTCALDDQAPVPCSSPFTFPHVTAGSHTLTVTSGTATDVSTFSLAYVVLCPPPAPHYAPASVAARWRVHTRTTSVRRLAVSGLSRGSRVALSCRGRGCPAHGWVSHVAGRSVDLTSFLRGRDLRPGARVVVRVSRIGFVTSTFTYTVRRGDRPLLRIR